jgi:exonuclease III
MQLATFNVNGIGSRLDNLLEWLARESPDIVCLQELKAADTAFPAKALKGPAMRLFGTGSGLGTGWRYSPSGRSL